MVYNPCGIKCLGIFGAIGVISGVVLLASFSPMYDAILEAQLIVSEGSYSYDLWAELPDELPMYMRIYYFNITNSEEIENRTSTYKPKPILQEVGPFTFREKHFKDVKSFNENGTVTFQQRKQWEFIEEESPSLDSMIVNFNMIALVSVQNVDLTRDKRIEVKSHGWHQNLFL